MDSSSEQTSAAPDRNQVARAIQRTQGLGFVLSLRIAKSLSDEAAARVLSEAEQLGAAARVLAALPPTTRPPVTSRPLTEPLSERTLPEPPTQPPEPDQE